MAFQRCENFEFEQQISQVEKKLYLSALCILRNREDAKDAVQEAIYHAYQKQHNLRNKDNFNVWITKIVINESYSIYNKRKPFADAIDIFECENLLFESIDSSDLNFFDMISHLKKDEKIIIILRYYNDFTVEEISKMLKIPLSTAKSRLYRAIEKIKNEMEKN